MDIWGTDKMFLFIAFVIPGFVSLKTYELLLASTPKESTKQLIDAIAYSCVNYALLFWPISVVEIHQVKTKFPNFYILFYVIVFLIAPVAWVLVFKKLRTTQCFQSIMPHPTGKPWDYVFSQRKPYWVIVTLKDGKQIAGLYDSSSFASSAPAPEQLYLEEAWVVNNDGGFERKRNDTAGIIILTPEIISIELFTIEQGGNHD